jgi:hypothetical protein
MGDLVNSDLPEIVPLIPGAVFRYDRIIVVGPDKIGKTKLVRQLGVQAAIGHHPFGGDAFEPLTVAMFDFEIDPGQSKAELRVLHSLAGDRYQERRFWLDATRMRVNLESEGDSIIEQLDILGPPDLVNFSPNYRIVGGSIIKDEVVTAVTDFFNTVMMAFNCAILTEGHWIKPQHGHQAIRPEGSGVWGHWATLVVALHEDGRLSFPNNDRFRHQRDWPSALREGDTTIGEWPWEAIYDPTELRFRYLAAIARTLPFKDRLNRRKIETAVNKDLYRRGTSRAEQLETWKWKGRQGNSLGENAIRSVIESDRGRWRLAAEIVGDATQQISNDDDDATE